MISIPICGVYRIRNTIDDKFYIGASKDIEKRWYDHRRHLKAGYHHNRRLQGAWNKHGEAVFEFAIVEIVKTRSLLVEREQAWINQTKSCTKGVGYNLSPFADRPSGREGRSKYYGVHWNATKQRWGCILWIEGRYQNAGYYKTEEEAAATHDALASCYYPGLRSLNFEGQIQPASIQEIRERNRHQRKAKTQSRHLGLEWSERWQKWRASIKIAGKTMHLGAFASEETAARVYDHAVLYYRGLQQQLNFSDSCQPLSKEEIERLYRINVQSKRQDKVAYQAVNRSRYTGVCFDKRRDLWVAYMNYNKQRHYLGSFTSELEAAQAYDQKAIEVLGDRAKLNLPCS